MNLVIYTEAQDKTASAVVGMTDTTPLTELEQLVLGDTPLISVTFTDGSAAPAWAGQSGYTMSLALGTPDGDGRLDYTQIQAETAITGGWEGNLPLDTPALVTALNLLVNQGATILRPPTQRYTYQAPRFAWFVLQIAVRAPDGYLTTYASLRVCVLNRVITSNFTEQQSPDSEIYAWTEAQLALKANIASPTFTGIPAAPTAAADTDTTQIATTAFVLGQASDATPLIDGTAAAGTSEKYARGNHVHPTDTSRAPLASPTFTGTPAAPTAAVDTSTTQLATTAFVIGQGYIKSQKVASISALKAISVASLTLGYSVNLLGYYLPGDGGGGLFYYDPSDSSSDNQGTVIQPNSGTGRWLRDYSGYVNVRWFGAKGDGLTDDTTAFQAAFNAVQGTYSTRDKGGVFIPQGVYLIGSTIQVNITGSDYLTPGIIGESVHSVTIKLKSGFTTGTALFQVNGGSPGVFWQSWGGFYIEGLGNGSDGGSDHIGIKIENLGGINTTYVAFDKIKKAVQMIATGSSFAEFNTISSCDFGDVTYWLEYVGNSSFHGSGLGPQCKGTVIGSQRCVKVTASGGNPNIYNAPFHAQVFGDATTILWEHGGATAARLFGNITIECSAAITLGTGGIQTFSGFINTPNFNPNLGTFAMIGAIGLTGVSYFPILNSTTGTFTGAITGPSHRAPSSTDLTIGTSVADAVFKYSATAAASYIDFTGFAKSATGPTVAALLIKSLGVSEAIYAAGNGRFGGAAATPASGTVVCAGDATFGGLIRGAGATYDVCLVNSVNSVVAGVPTGTQTLRCFGPISPSQSTVTWTAGSGTPEGVVTAPVGSLFSRTDGGAGTSLYVKQTGTGNTGWVGK